jgi:hypothetical protein
MLLEWTLRIFGAFWIVGGGFAIQQARLLDLMENAMETLTNEKEDRLLTRFLFLGGVLTMLSGLGLLIVSRWVFLPLGLLIGSQVIYFAVKRQRFLKAKTAEEREDAEVTPQTQNAFIACLVVAIAAFIALNVGILK